MVISLLYENNTKQKNIFKFFAYLIAVNIVFRSSNLNLLYNARNIWFVNFVADT